MRRLERRAIICMTLAAVLLAGMGALNVGSSLMFFGLYFLLTKADSKETGAAING